MKRRSAAYITILVIQIACATVFVGDILFSVLGIPVSPMSWRVRELMEIGAVVGLLAGALLGALLLQSAHSRTRSAERALQAASGAFMVAY